MSRYSRFKGHFSGKNAIGKPRKMQHHDMKDIEKSSIEKNSPTIKKPLSQEDYTTHPGKDTRPLTEKLLLRKKVTGVIVWSGAGGSGYEVEATKIFDDGTHQIHKEFYSTKEEAERRADEIRRNNREQFKKTGRIR